MDLLVSRFNVKLNRFTSRTRYRQAFAVGALVTLWDQFSLIYAFHPLQLLLILEEGIPRSLASVYHSLAQENVVLRQHGPFQINLARSNLPFLFTVAGFNGMAGKARGLRDRSV